jgi:hypothetical protein
MFGKQVDDRYTTDGLTEQYKKIFADANVLYMKKSHLARKYMPGVLENLGYVFYPAQHSLSIIIYLSESLQMKLTLSDTGNKGWVPGANATLRRFPEQCGFYTYFSFSLTVNQQAVAVIAGFSLGEVYDVP